MQTTQEEVASLVPESSLIFSYFDNLIGGNISKVGTIIKGNIVSINLETDVVIVNSGLKSNYAIPLKEFFDEEEKRNLHVGQEISVYLTSADGKLSKENEIRERSLNLIKDAFNNGEIVEGIIFGKVKGGLVVDINGTVAFLPGSQIDENPVKDISALVGRKHKFKIISIDNRNIVLSRKDILDKQYQDVRSNFFNTAKEGDTISGIVKNITDYGVFLDISLGIDALIHVSDISWSKVNHPSEVLKIGEKVTAKILKLEQASNKISLSIKNLTENPWGDLLGNLKVGDIIKGVVTNIVDYGFFVEINKQIEGLVHLSEIAFSKDVHKKHKDYKPGDVVEAMIIEIDIDKQRIGLSLKRLTKNPWKEFADKHKEGETIAGTIVKILEYGLLVKLNEEIDGLLYIDDMFWCSDSISLSSYKIDDTIKVVYLGTDTKNSKIRLGLKQLTENPFEVHKVMFKTGNNITCKVTALKSDRIEVKIVEGVFSSIKKMNLSREKTEQRIDRFVVGDRVDAKIILFDEKTNKIVLSIKDLEDEQHNEMMEKYGKNKDTGASIADILGVALEDAKK